MDLLVNMGSVIVAISEASSGTISSSFVASR